jgi:2,3-bisphosphoglycerate-dependent phosphoglycerate mutase
VELYLIRHGQSYNNTLPSAAGRVCDPPLTEVGRRQADLVGQYLRSAPTKCPGGSRSAGDGCGLTRLYCSAHLRCLQTAERIAQHTGLTAQIWVEVHEEMGIWLEGVAALPGLTSAQIRAQFPRIRIPADMPPDGWWNRPAETESEWMGRAARVARQLRLEMAQPEERIAVISHGGFIRDLLVALVGVDPAMGATFSTQNTGIGRIDLAPDTLHVRYLNRLEHLPPELVT